MVLDAISDVRESPAGVDRDDLAGGGGGIRLFLAEFDQAGGRGAGYDAALGRREFACGASWSISRGPIRHTRRWPWRSCTVPAG